MGRASRRAQRLTQVQILEWLWNTPIKAKKRNRRPKRQRDDLWDKDPRESQWWKMINDRRVQDPESREGKLFRRRFRCPSAFSSGLSLSGEPKSGLHHRQDHSHAHKPCLLLILSKNRYVLTSLAHTWTHDNDHMFSYHPHTHYLAYIPKKPFTSPLTSSLSLILVTGAL